MALLCVHLLPQPRCVLLPPPPGHRPSQLDVQYKGTGPGKLSIVRCRKSAGGGGASVRGGHTTQEERTHDTLLCAQQPLRSHSLWLTRSFGSFSFCPSSSLLPSLPPSSPPPTPQVMYALMMRPCWAQPPAALLHRCCTSVAPYLSARQVEDACPRSFRLRYLHELHQLIAGTYSSSETLTYCRKDCGPCLEWEWERERRRQHCLECSCSLLIPPRDTLGASCLPPPFHPPSPHQSWLVSSCFSVRPPYYTALLIS